MKIGPPKSNCSITQQTVSFTQALVDFTKDNNISLNEPQKNGSINKNLGWAKQLLYIS